MELAQQIRLNTAKNDVQGYNRTTILLGCSAFAILFLVALGLAVSGPGFSPAELAITGAFP